MGLPTPEQLTQAIRDEFKDFKLPSDILGKSAVIRDVWKHQS